jgi:hypothetical protein
MSDVENKSENEEEEEVEEIDFENSATVQLPLWQLITSTNARAYFKEIGDMPLHRFFTSHHLPKYDKISDNRCKAIISNFIDTFTKDEQLQVSSLFSDVVRRSLTLLRHRQSKIVYDGIDGIIFTTDDPVTGFLVMPNTISVLSTARKRFRKGFDDAPVYHMYNVMKRALNMCLQDFPAPFDTPDALRDIAPSTFFPDLMQFLYGKNVDLDVLPQTCSVEPVRKNYHSVNKIVSSIEQKANNYNDNNTMTELMFNSTNRKATSMLSMVGEKKCVHVDENALFIPVSRIDNLFHTKKPGFCGKFYFFERDSPTYLSLGRSRFFASKVHAYDVLLHELRDIDPDLYQKVSGKPLSQEEYKFQYLAPACRGYEFCRGIFGDRLHCHGLWNLIIKDYPGLSQYFDEMKLRKNDRDADYQNAKDVASMTYDQLEHVYRIVHFALFAIMDAPTKVHHNFRFEKMFTDFMEEYLKDYEKRGKIYDQTHFAPFKSMILLPPHRLFPSIIDSDYDNWIGAADGLDQPLCNLARKLGIDTLILQSEVGRRDAVTEILDTRSDSYTHLCQFQEELVCSQDVTYHVHAQPCPKIFFLKRDTLFKRKGSTAIPYHILIGGPWTSNDADDDEDHQKEGQFETWLSTRRVDH